MAKERSTWDNIWDLLDPFPKQAQAWNLPKGITNIARPAMDRLIEAIELLSGKPITGSTLEKASKLGASHIGTGWDASVWKMGPHVIKVRKPEHNIKKSRLFPDLRLGNLLFDATDPKVKGMPPILHRVESPQGLLGYVTPYIPGAQPMGTVYGGVKDTTLDALDIVGRYADQHPTKRLWDIHSGNIIESPWTDINRPRGWVVDLGAQEVKGGTPAFNAPMTGYLMRPEVEAAIKNSSNWPRLRKLLESDEWYDLLSN